MFVETVRPSSAQMVHFKAGHTQRLRTVRALRWCSEFALNVTLDGLVRPNPYPSRGILGGAWRRPGDRKAAFRKNFPIHLVRAIKQDILGLIVPCPFHGEDCDTQKVLRRYLNSTGTVKDASDET